jgi:hypothetical protein
MLVTPFSATEAVDTKLASSNVQPVMSTAELHAAGAHGFRDSERRDLGEGRRGKAAGGKREGDDSASG